MARFEAQLGRLSDASLNTYGALPNPQLATESAKTSSTNDVTQSVGVDPVYGTVISAAPTGNAPQSNAKQALSQSTLNPFKYDRSAYQAAQKQMWSDHPDYAKKFADINGVPIANVGYFDDTMYWVSQDQNQAKAWQKHLMDAGVYDSTDSQGHVTRDRTTVDGQWTQRDSQALGQYLIQMGTPDALYNKDANVQSRAAMSISEIASRLGGQLDVSQLRTELSQNKNNEQQAMLAFWLKAHPGVNPHDLLNEYADRYGKQNLPQNIQKIVDPAWWQKIINIPGEALDAFTTMESGSSSDNPVNQWLFGRLNIDPKSSFASLVMPSLYESSVKSGLTPADVAAVQPVISQVEAHRSYLSELLAPASEASTRAKLTFAWVLHPQGDPNAHNPFDVGAHWKDSDKFQDNFTAGVFGEQWVKDNPAAAQIINVSTGMIDPTILLGPVGRSLTMGRLISTTEEAMTAARAAEEADSVLNTSALAEDTSLTNKLSLPATACRATGTMIT